MANKEYEFSYGSMSIPNSESRYSIIRWGWKGLNRTDTIDSGNITDCSNVDINPPYIDSCADFKPYAAYNILIGIFGFDNFLIVIYVDGGNVKVDYRKGDVVYTGVISNPADVKVPRSVVQFNVAENTENIVASSFNRKLLIFPDKYSMDFSPKNGNLNLSYLGNDYPDINYATVYGSRVFGVDNNLVYASYFNDYARWDLDTADDTSNANAWVSMSQSNVKADGEFTGICTYDNHVVLFKKDFTQLVYNNKNPFRIVDLTAYGAENCYAIAEAGGVLYFASSDNVYAFTGGTPKAIGDELDIKWYHGVCLGGYKDKLYMYADGKLYRYKSGVWSVRDTDKTIHQFATNDKGIYALCTSGDIVQIDGDFIENSSGESGSGAPSYSSWWFETDIMCAGKLDIRRAKKLSMLCDIAPGAKVSVYLLRDNEIFSESTSVKVLESTGNGRKLLRGMIRGFGGYAHKLRICGTGKVRIYAAELLISWGGDIYKNN